MSAIDFRRHGVIEAHAGTGKTWTIVNDLVLPMIMGEGGERTHIRDICIVTYTDKAAEELKMRIRKGICDTIDRLHFQGGPEGLAAHCGDCLDNIHESPMGTIHGICLRFLKSYPFETGMQFETAMADDVAGLTGCLRDTIREVWPRLGIDPALFGRGNGPGILRGLISRIVAIAKECSDPDVILEDIAIEHGRTIQTINDDIGRRAGLEAALVGMVAENVRHLLLLERAPLGLDDDRLLHLREVVARWKSIVRCGMINTPADIIGKGRGPDALANKLMKNNSEGMRKNYAIEAACGAFRAVAGSPEFIAWKEMADYTPELSAAILLQTVPEVCRRWNDKKKREGLLSFGDMLRRTRDAVYEHDEFRRILRAKISYAIIDEFQDTSVLQWEIFKRLFIDDAGDGRQPRLFIVGDPKQSIYSFQNAVVESYVDACAVIKNLPGSPPPVERKINYRSTERMVDAYNRIFTGDMEDGFFATPGIRYTVENQVTAPKRTPANREGTDAVMAGLIGKPLQIVPVYGSSQDRRRQFAACITGIIAATYKKKVALPVGGAYETVELDYHHYAVIAETHTIADMLLHCLLDAGIPACKYKQEGIFTSLMAREWRTLLAALIIDGQAYLRRAKALPTSFFNCNPSIAAGEGMLARNSTVESRLDHWAELAEEQAWPRLFRSILRESGVGERLIQLNDGERRLSDLRQLMDFSIEYCITQGATLEDLLQHLTRLERGYELPPRDASLHAKESDRKKVQVMTIHAAKGLEFPVCFVACGGSKKLRADYMRWTERSLDKKEGGRYRLHIAPVVSAGNSKTNEAVENSRTRSESQLMQERRRLLYVALTRAKVLQFVPMQLESEMQGDGTYMQCKLPRHNGDHDLTPVLQKLADEAMSAEADTTDFPIGVFNYKAYTGVNYSAAEKYPGDHIGPLTAEVSEKLTAVERTITQALSDLHIGKRVRRRTSYSALAGSVHVTAGSEGTEAGEHDNEYPVMTLDVPAEELLLVPPGKQTGNVLHEMIATAVAHPDGLSWVFGENSPPFFMEAARRSMEKHYQSGYDAISDNTARLHRLTAVVRNALGHAYMLPGYRQATIAALEYNDRIAEAEFLESFAPDYLVGYIDLLYRLKNDDGSYRYFIIDWKSNLLSGYSPGEIEANVTESSYDMQAKLYCHALDRWLKIQLGAAYVPEKNIGGALYVYLRGLATATGREPTWFYKADPEHDGCYTQDLIGHHLSGRKGNLTHVD